MYYSLRDPAKNAVNPLVEIVKEEGGRVKLSDGETYPTEVFQAIYKEDK